MCIGCLKLNYGTSKCASCVWKRMGEQAHADDKKCCWFLSISCFHQAFTLVRESPSTCASWPNGVLIAVQFADAPQILPAVTNLALDNQLGLENVYHVIYICMWMARRCRWYMCTVVFERKNIRGVRMELLPGALGIHQVRVPHKGGGGGDRTIFDGFT